LNTNIDDSTSVESNPQTTAVPTSVDGKKEQDVLEQHQKRSGKVIKKTESGLEISGKFSNVDAIVSSPEILKDIQIGDTVTIYAPIFIDGLVFGQPDTAENAIVQKENEENVLKKQYKKHTGNVINKTKNAIEISSEGTTVSAIVSSEFLQDINMGDTVTIYASDFEKFPIGDGLGAKAPIIEKLGK
ncbi:S-layer homology domain-containing protein, partial [Bacillus albus]